MSGFRRLGPAVVAAGLFVVSCVAACGGTTRGPAAADGAEARREAESLWNGKCGACHVKVPPGSRPRATFEAATRRHRKRVRLTEAQWANLLEFLSPPGGSAPSAGAGR